MFLKHALVKRKFCLNSLHFPQDTPLLTETRGECSDSHSIFRLRALRYLQRRPLKLGRLIVLWETHLRL